MLIGIDMLGVQSPEGGDRETGRYGRQLVAALLASDPARRFVLYTHEGLPTSRVPSARNALRVSQAPVAGSGSSRLRPTIQRLMDRNPEGLDWIVLLDPFDKDYGGLPPESPLNGLKVASVVHDLAPVLSDDRRLVPLRRHDAILAVSEATALDCRRRLGSASPKVSTIGLACDATFAAPDSAEPLTRVAGDELGRLGISGPFLFASLDGSGESTSVELGVILEAYHRLPVEHRLRHQLVVAGVVEDPAAVRSYLIDRGCAQGLALVGEVNEATLRTLYGRCAAFISPSTGHGPGLSLVEAMRCGAPVIAGRTGSQPEIIGDAGLLVDPSDPAGLAAELTDLLSDSGLERDFRERAIARSAHFAWGPVVKAVVASLSGGASTSARRVRWRIDRGNVARPRIAVFPDVSRDGPARVDLESQIPAGWTEAYNIDLYLEPGDAALVDGLPAEFGGFDARQFERNDALLSYHAVIYRIGDVDALNSKLWRLSCRPGLVFLVDEAFLDLVGPEPASTSMMKARSLRSELATARLRDVFRTGSRVVVRSPRHFERIAAILPEFADQLVEIPPPGSSIASQEARREKARARLDLLPGSFAVGLFGRSGEVDEKLITRRILDAVPDLVVLTFDSRDERGSDDPDDCVLAGLDLAVDTGDADPIAILKLLRAGVATISVGSDFPDFVVRNVSPSPRNGELARAVRELFSDPATRSTLSRSAMAYSTGIPDAARASSMLLDQVERCAFELSRVPGRRRPAARSLGLLTSPHFPRPASATDEAASRSR